MVKVKLYEEKFYILFKMDFIIVVLNDRIYSGVFAGAWN